MGESGAGKTLTSEAILRLIRCPPGRIRGEILYRGRNLLQLDEAELADIRGKEIAMIFQNPISSLNPVFRVGAQLLETMALHLPERRRTLRRAGHRHLDPRRHPVGSSDAPRIIPTSSAAACASAP